MGIGDFLEEAAGGLAAEQIADKLDPNAGILVKGAAALAGFEGVGMVKEHLDGGQAPAADASSDADAGDTSAQDDSQNN